MSVGLNKVDWKDILNPQPTINIKNILGLALFCNSNNLYE